MLEWVLPLPVDVQFAVDRLDWAGPPELRLDGLRGRYRFDGQRHRLQDAALQMAAGSYRLNADLQARKPMALSLQASGSVQAPLTLQQAGLQLQADATLQGTLVGPDAVLQVLVNVQPLGASRPLGAMQASLQAQIRPGQVQPIASASGNWSALDLAALWPQAPHTRLSGQAQVVPDGAAWKAEVQLQNSLVGPLDQQRLPLQSAKASLRYEQAQWLLCALQVTGAGGTLQAEGRYAGRPAQWSVQARLHGLAPQQIDTRWAGAALDGSVSVQQTLQGLAFDTALSTAPGAAGPVFITRLLAQGRWAAPQLQLDHLELEAGLAQLSGQLQIDTGNLASSGHVRAVLPGAEFSLDGAAAAGAGRGQVTLQVRDAQSLQRWLASLPVLGARLQGQGIGVEQGVQSGLALRGAADMSLQWNGGWRKLGAELQLQAAASAQRLHINSQRLSDVQLELKGTLAAWALQLRGKAETGAQQLTLELQAHGGQLLAGQWHARLDSLRLAVRDGLQATPWSMQLQQPVEMGWQQSAQQRAFALAAGTLRVIGPAPGSATLEWQPLQWSQKGATGSPRWSSRGEWQAVPLAWLELLGQARIANLGLRGDLVFGGQWEASQDGAAAQGLRLNASLQRSSGDLQLLASESGQPPLAAGLREARLSVSIQRDVLHADLLWASEAGGNARAEFNTPLQTGGGSTLWAADAPVEATIHASLPRVGLWSLVAPVGWRMHGTLEADAKLTGSRDKPLWKGSVAARDMSIRSVVDGIDFSNGVMRLQINDQHMDITEFTLRGAGGAAGGQLRASGSVDWLPGNPETPVASRLRMALEAQAQGFRVAARPDQRLVASGKLQARLEDARLTVRGALVADQALFVLPEDTAPKLGADVVVRRPKAAYGPAVPGSQAPQRRAQSVLTDVLIALDPGSQFQLQGHGLNTRLAGQLTLKAEGRDALPQLLGELRTVNGTYRAYGQRLTIEEGSLRFNGAYDNPALNIRAVRPNLAQVVGVQVGGTAQLPVVRLFSEPDLPDAEKLSWLILGHTGTNGGAETALLQQAALALLAGKGAAPTDGLIQAVGLDEVSLGRAATTNLDGSSGSEATVKLGKRLSRDFYVAYERSLAGTLGTFYVFYDLSRRFTLRGESGAQSAVDLIFTSRFD
jgi:translocation and assembly module TamB